MPMMNVNGVSLHYHIQGRGTPVIFIHPPYIASRIFQYQKYQLSEQHKAVTFDIRGHGRSGSSPVPLTFPVIVEDMKQLLDALDIEQAYVCGYSVGSMVALEALLTSPQRFCGGIMISGTPAIQDVMTRSQVVAGAVASTPRSKSALGFTIAWGNADNRLTFDHLRNEAHHGDPAKWKEYSRCCLTFDCADRLFRIKQPMLLIYGERDHQFHRYAHLMHDQLPDSELYFIRGMRHQLPTKAPEKVSNLISQWIAKQNGGDAAYAYLDRHMSAAEQVEQAEQGIIEG